MKLTVLLVTLASAFVLTIPEYGGGGNTVGGPIKGPAIKGPFPKKMKWAFVP